MSGVVEPTESSAWSARTLLPGDHRAPRAARRVVSTLLLAWGYRAPVELVELVASELVSNAVRRAGPAEVLEVDLWADDSLVWISVADSSAVAPPGPGTADPSLHLVEQVAAGWGVEGYLLGYRVWAAVPAVSRPIDDTASSRDA